MYKENLEMGIFEPSILLAVFPYLFIGIFPVFGLLVVTKLLIDDRQIKKQSLGKNTDQSR